VWQIHTGKLYAVITAVTTATPLPDVAERVAATIRARWDIDQIIEHWPDGGPTGPARYLVSNEHGGHRAVDHRHLDAAGLVLREPRRVGTTGALPTEPIDTEPLSYVRGLTFDQVRALLDDALDGITLGTYDQRTITAVKETFSQGMITTLASIITRARADDAARPTP
jgi:hypothetical protein